MKTHDQVKRHRSFLLLASFRSDAWPERSYRVSESGLHLLKMCEERIFFFFLISKEALRQSRCLELPRTPKLPISLASSGRRKTRRDDVSREDQRTVRMQKRSVFRKKVVLARGARLVLCEISVFRRRERRALGRVRGEHSRGSAVYCLVK